LPKFSRVIARLVAIHLVIGACEHRLERGTFFRGRRAKRKREWQIGMRGIVRGDALARTRDDFRGGRGVGVRQEHGELVAADARHDILRAKSFAQNLRGIFQSRIADRVPKTVIDLFQSVHVRHHHRYREQATVFQTLKFVFKPKPIVNPGECVVRAKIFQFRFGEFTFGDIARDVKRAGNAPVFLQNSSAHFERNARAGFTHRLDFHLHYSVGLENRRERGGGLGFTIRRNKIERTRADQFFRAIFQRVAHRAIDERDFASRVERENQIVRLLDVHSPAFFAGEQRALGTLPTQRVRKNFAGRFEQSNIFVSPIFFVPHRIESQKSDQRLLIHQGHREH